MKNILMVDDSPMIRNLLRKTLEKNGYNIVAEGRNGKEGVELFKSTNPDVVFMDITMPVMDGLDAAREIKSGNKDAKVIMLTAMGDDEVIGEAKSIGVDVFLKKPFDDYKIISALAKIEGV